MGETKKASHEKTRLFVKNLPKHLTEDRFRKHFENKGLITDAKILRTKDGQSRKIGFVGFRNEKEAVNAQKYFHRTFLDTSRILVEFALPKGDNALARPWSKYSEGSSRFQKITENKIKEERKARKRNRKQQQKALKKEERLQKKSKLKDEEDIDEDALAKKEFANLLKKRSATKVWANDDLGAPQQEKTGKLKKERETDSEMSSSEESDNEGDENEENEAVEGEEHDQEAQVAGSLAVNRSVSDMDYLRSKVSKNLTRHKDKNDDDDDGSDESSSENSESNEENDSELEEEGMKDPEQSNLPSEHDEEDETETGRLFVRNLPFAVTEDELTKLFSKFGELIDVHISVDEAKKSKGFGFVQFILPEHAKKAMEELDRTSFQGRLLHVLPARRQPGTDHGSEELEKNLTYKAKKELERRKKAGDQTGWHASYVRSDAVVDALADRLGVEKGDILDREGSSSMAVKLAVGETHLIQENKEYFESEGVDLGALETTKSKGKAVERSKVIILVKNLPFTTEVAQLSQMFAKFGNLGRVLLPPSKTVALVEFVEASEARRAFKSLAYKRFQHVPLYLEWAPTKVFKETTPKNQQSRKEDKMEPENVKAQMGNGADGMQSKNLADEEDLDSSTLYVKNLSFDSTEAKLKQTFERLVNFRAVSIPKKKKGNKILSMGYGFVEFGNKVAMQKALRTMQGHVLDGHALELKPSMKKLTTTGKVSKQKKTEQKTKILVRNLAFQATAKEVRALFAEFGELKKVRVPRKFDGNNRGFAFVEFLTAQEALSAFQSLESTHLYGRHLVLEWAKDEESIEDLRGKASKDLGHIKASHKKRKVAAAFEEAF